MEEIRKKAIEVHTENNAIVEEIENLKEKSVENMNSFIKSYLATQENKSLNVEEYGVTLNEDGFDFTVISIGVNDNGKVYVYGSYDYTGTASEVELESAAYHYDSFLILFDVIYRLITFFSLKKQQ